VFEAARETEAVEAADVPGAPCPGSTLFGTKETLATVLPLCSLLVLSAAPRKSRVVLTVGFKLEHKLRLFSPLAGA
jgi:hypothetical protein